MRIILICMIVCFNWALSFAENDIIKELLMQREGAAFASQSKVTNNSNGFNMELPKSLYLSGFNRNTGSTGNITQSLGFDENIDENKYLVGTGDGFLIHIWGPSSKQIESTVNIEGKFVIPEVGDVDVKGETLFSAKEKIKNKLLSYYKRVDISIYLNKVREFKVYLLGEVKTPGAYYVSGATRVSDLLQISGGANDSASLRDIKIVNTIDSSEYLADMALFYYCNVIDRNRYLNEGDRVFVKKNNELVSVNGAICYPGDINYVDNDSLSTILNIAGGLVRGADSNRIIVKRFENNIDSLSTYVCSYNDSSVYKFLLKRDDRIFVSYLPDYRVLRNVVIKGEVFYPGTYPIKKDKTTLGEIIEMAGGLTKDANLKSSKIVRNFDAKAGSRELERLIKMPAEYLSPLEKNYMYTRLTDQEGIVSIDLEALQSKNDEEVKQFILKNGDEITISSNVLSVKLMGGLVKPGLIEYRSGANIGYYIDRAGGFNSRAYKRRTKIMKNGSENWKDENDINSIEPGDVIWVPEKPYRSGYNITKETIVLLGSIATVIVSVFTIKELIRD